jgi:integrase
MTDEQFEENRAHLEGDMEESRAAVSRGKVGGGLAAMIEEFLVAQGIEIDPASENYQRIAYAIAKADVRAMEMMQGRDRGELVETPELPGEIHVSISVPPSARTDGTGGGARLRDLFAYWKAQKAPKPKTIVEAESILRRFREVHGDLGVPEIEKRHVLALRDALVARGRAPGTVKKGLGLLGSMFQTALEDDGRFGLKGNPVRDVKKVGEAKARRFFSRDELSRIFAASVFTRGERPQGGAGEAAFWLPLLALFTGARLNEIGQLRVHDVREDAGIQYIAFTAEGEGQSIKTGGIGKRHVPLHPELLRIGFMDYVRAMRTRGEDRLFPELRPDSHGHVTGRWSRWFNRYLDSVIGIDDPRVDFHSFRHTFKVFARSAEIPEDVHDSLTGHSNVSVARAYGSAEGYPLAPLAKGIERLTFPGPDQIQSRTYLQSATAL